MTETEWLASDNPQWMLARLRDRGDLTERKRRLFTVACCVRIWHLMSSGAKFAVGLVERYADGQMRAEAVRRAWETIGHAKTEARRIAASAARSASYPPDLNYDDSSGVASSAASAAAAELSDRRGDDIIAARAMEEAAQARLLRDIFGNPFRPVTLDQNWLTSTVVALAKQMYESRDFGAMPILADALQDAGCDNEDVLNHCRGAGPHVRGCWVVDLVLGKV